MTTVKTTKYDSQRRPHLNLQEMPSSWALFLLTLVLKIWTEVYLTNFTLVWYRNSFLCWCHGFNFIQVLKKIWDPAPQDCKVTVWSYCLPSRSPLTTSLEGKNNLNSILFYVQVSFCFTHFEQRQYHNLLFSFQSVYTHNQLIYYLAPPRI